MNPPALPSGRKPSNLLTVSLWNGGSVVALAGFSTLICLALKLWLGVLIGLLVTASGMMELWGRHLAKKGGGRARFWLPFSQIWLLLVLVIYCLWSMIHSEIEELLPRIMPSIEMLGVDAEIMMVTMKQMVIVTYTIIILVSCIYQGGLAWYYLRATREISPKWQSRPGSDL